jgi:DNA-binding transcriptional LysR family regulator
MADFAKWATACEPALWKPGTFVSAYDANRMEAIETVIEADPVATGLRQFMATKTEWTGTASELLGSLSLIVTEAERRGKAWPAAPNRLSGRLRRQATFLRQVGIKIEQKRSDKIGTRMLIITREERVLERDAAGRSIPSLGPPPLPNSKITASVALGHALLPRISRAYAAKYPDVSLELILTNRIVDLVEEGVDLAIRFAGALKDSSLIARRFFETGSDLWASPKYMKVFGKPTHPRDLANAAFVTHPFQKGSVLLTNGKSDFQVQMPLARAVKKATRMPVIAVGLITEFEQAEAIVGTGDADLIALARTILYNPRWPWQCATSRGVCILPARSGATTSGTRRSRHTIPTGRSRKSSKRNAVTQGRPERRRAPHRRLQAESAYGSPGCRHTHRRVGWRAARETRAADNRAHSVAGQHRLRAARHAVPLQQMPDAPA